MKTKLLFTKLHSNTLNIVLVLCLCFNYGWSQNLMQNPTCDDHNATSTSDNADAYDMTPNNTIDPNDTPSPYQPVWDNDDLDQYLRDTYNGGGNLDEQPGSTSDGNGDTRGVKLYNDGNPVAQAMGVCTRRIYQKVVGLTIGNDYTFSVDSRSRSMNIPSEVFMLNADITTEVGLENGAADSRVDAFLNITNDFNTDSDIFTTNSITFTASNTFVVVYIRALNAWDDGDNQTYYDNFSLVEETLSVDDFSISNFKVYPNPASDFITIESNSIEVSGIAMYDILGKKVLSLTSLKNNTIDVSNLNNGVYFLKINANGNSTTKKIIIQ